MPHPGNWRQKRPQTKSSKIHGQVFPPPPKLFHRGHGKLRIFQIYQNKLQHYETQNPKHHLKCTYQKVPRIGQNPRQNPKACLEPLLPHLHQIFNAYFTMGYYPSHFKTLVTIVRCKPAGKRNYTQAKSWRLIAPLNIMGKIFESIMAYRLSYMIEPHQFLPTTHFGGQKNIVNPARSASPIRAHSENLEYQKDCVFATLRRSRSV